MGDTGVSSTEMSQANGGAGVPERDSPGPAVATATAQRGAASYLETVRTAAAFLRRPDGPRVAVFDTTGWDTHFNEGGSQGQLRARLSVLDQALRLLKESMGASWSSTAVLLATEFGRTAAVNGTRGTDHGTGAAAFLLGGAIEGGRVLADWPGLSTNALYQARDLKPTLDLRTVAKSVLRDHLHIATRALDGAVFPESGARYLSGLIRCVAASHCSSPGSDLNAGRGTTHSYV